MKDIQISLNLFASGVGIVGRIALVFLLVGQGKVCAVTTLLGLNQYLGMS